MDSEKNSSAPVVLEAVEGVHVDQLSLSVTSILDKHVALKLDGAQTSLEISQRTELVLTLSLCKSGLEVQAAARTQRT